MDKTLARVINEELGEDFVQHLTKVHWFCDFLR